MIHSFQLNSFIHSNFGIKIESFTPPTPSVSEHQWYHGTLDRSESNQVLLKYAKSLTEADRSDEPQVSSDITSITLPLITIIKKMNGIFVAGYIRRIPYKIFKARR